MTCYRSTTAIDDCGFSAAYLQFFMISSELWFLLSGVDLYYTVTNPFSTLQSRLFYNHLGVWSITFMITFLPFINHKNGMYGFWYENPSGDYAFCWLNSASTKANIWSYFLVPVILIYVVCSGSLIFAYFRLKRGISKTFLPRLSLLVTNTANVVTLLLFWMTTLILYVS